MKICCQCDGVIEENMEHSCIRGLADKIDYLVQEVQRLQITLARDLEIAMNKLVLKSLSRIL
jgi:hypothetical protein